MRNDDEYGSTLRERMKHGMSEAADHFRPLNRKRRWLERMLDNLSMILGVLVAILVAMIFVIQVWRYFYG